MKVILLLITVLLVTTRYKEVRAAQEVAESESLFSQWSRRLYNTYKGYQDSPPSERPPQYSKEMHRKPDPKEFLAPDQLRVMNLRHSNLNDLKGHYNGFEAYKKMTKDEPKAKGKAKGKTKGKAKGKSGPERTVFSAMPEAPNIDAMRAKAKAAFRPF